MRGKIAVEEAVTMPELVATFARGAPNYSAQAAKAMGDKLLDIHETRLKEMDANGVEYQLLAVTAPGAQGIYKKEEAEALATRANDYLAAEVKKNPQRFGALCSLSMHDPAQAAQELERAVKMLGFFGGLVNDYQSVDDEEGMIFFDQPEYDVFWKKVEELDVIIYIHPRPQVPSVNKTLFAGRKWLEGAALAFTFGVATHTLGLCVNGVFDRFPGARIAIGHGGEMIPYNLWRTDNRLKLFGKARGLPMAKPLRHYFAHNIYITTSGWYSTPGLICAMTELGASRCMFAIDYPYEDTAPGCEWWDRVPISATDQVDIGRNNAIKAFKLPLPLNKAELE